MGEEDEEEDYGALIYRESQLRKAEAAAVAAKSVEKKKKSSLDVSSTSQLYISTSCNFNSGDSADTPR